MKPTSVCDCDVAVVGAGPAGSAAAVVLARNGADVWLLDKSDFPRSKLCAGLLTWKTVDIMQTILGKNMHVLKDQGVLHHATRKYAVYNSDQILVRGNLDFPFHVVERRDYDQFWLNEARRAGVRLFLKTEVAALDTSQSRICTTRDEKIRARFILAADGVHSRVRNFLAQGSKNKQKWSAGLAYGLEAAISGKTSYQLPDFPSLHLGHVPWGYAWSFPGPAGHILGIMGLKTKAGLKIKTYFRDFLTSQSLPHRIAQSAKAYPLPYGNFLEKPGKGSVLLLGDACGLADPILGEGIYYAHLSGKIAAETVLNVMSHPGSAADEYRKRLERTLLKGLRRAKHCRNLLFTLLRYPRYRPFAFLMRRYQKIIEEIIQGHRPFSRIRTRLPRLSLK